MDAAMNAAVSALKSESQALSTISNNLANSGTTGYKAVSTQFLSLLSSGSGGNSYPAGGVSSVARQNVTLGGNITSTTSATDMAIDGNGMFVLSDESGASTFYTRNGAFETDSTGNLYLNGTSYYLKGWTTDATGAVTAANAGNVASLETVNVKKYNSTATATTAFTFKGNLPDEGQSSVNSVSYTNTSGSTESLNYSWAKTGTNTAGNNTYLVSVTPSVSGVTLDDGTTSGVDQLTYTVETDSTGAIVSVNSTTSGVVTSIGTELPSSITASDGAAAVDTTADTWAAVKAKTGFSASTSMTTYDSLGTEEDYPTTWTAAGNNTWIMTVGTPTNATGSSTTGLLADSSGVSTSTYSYSVAFNSDGTLKSITPLSTDNAGVLSTAPTDSNGDVVLKTYSWDDGAAAGSVTLNLGTTGKTDGLSQYDTGQTTPTISNISTSQDGVQYGSLSSVAVNSAGEIVATYSNKQTVVIYKLALATFPNEDGLSAKNDSVYQQTTASGSYTLNASGDNGTGTIQGKALENSTVDTSTEFSNMISCQQAYQAASQVISTGKTMFSTLLQSVQ